MQRLFSEHFPNYTLLDGSDNFSDPDKIIRCHRWLNFSDKHLIYIRIQSSNFHYISLLDPTFKNNNGHVLLHRDNYWIIQNDKLVTDSYLHRDVLRFLTGNLEQPCCVCQDNKTLQQQFSCHECKAGICAADLDYQFNPCCIQHII